MPERVAGNPDRKVMYVITGFLIVMIVIVTAMLAAVGGRLFSAPQQNPAPTPSPIVTLNQLEIDVPRVRVDSPRNEVEIGNGDILPIRMMAFDRQGVTRVELRLEESILQTVTSQQPDGEREFPAEMIFQPNSPGRYILELIAYRGNLAGEPGFIRVTVR